MPSVLSLLEERTGFLPIPPRVRPHQRRYIVLFRLQKQTVSMYLHIFSIYFCTCRTQTGRIIRKNWMIWCHGHWKYRNNVSNYCWGWYYTPSSIYLVGTILFSAYHWTAGTRKLDYLKAIYKSPLQRILLKNMLSPLNISQTAKNDIFIEQQNNKNYKSYI